MAGNRIVSLRVLRKNSIIPGLPKYMLKTHLTKPRKDLRHSYVQLIRRLEKDMRNLTDHKFKEKLKCRPGCKECCTKFSILPLEAAIILEYLEKSGITCSGNDRAKCSFLVNGLCTVYGVRPLICRTQGLPIAYIDADIGVIQVSACHLNFADDYRFSEEDLLYLDTFNLELAELNSLYCQSTGLDPTQRIDLSVIIKKN